MKLPCRGELVESVWGGIGTLRLAPEVRIMILEQLSSSSHWAPVHIYIYICIYDLHWVQKSMNSTYTWSLKALQKEAYPRNHTYLA